MSLLQSVADHVAPLIFLQPSQMWPISTESAPFLIGLWLCLVTALLSVIFAKHKNFALERARKIRYDTKIKTLKNLVYLEERRLANKTSCKEEENESENMDDMPLEEKAPTSQFIYDIIYEKIEGQPIDEVIDISKNDPLYLRAVLFLGQRLKVEIEEAKDNTFKAQDLFLATSMNVTEEQQVILDHQDGEKLAKLLEFAKENFLKEFVTQFGRTVKAPHPVEGASLHHFDATYLVKDVTEIEIFDENILTEAENVSSQVRGARRRAFFFIIDILRPVLPTFGLSVLFLLLARAFEAPLWAQSLPTYKSSIAMINPNATVGQFGFGPDVVNVAKGHLILFLVGFLFSRPLEMLASTFEERATREFSGPLRTAVMKAIMKQDTEYFDFNPSAALQERLNHDTNELVENMLRLPIEAMGFIFRVIQRIMTLYFVAPTMLWACLSFNVPVFAIITLTTERSLKRLYEQQDRSRDNAVTDTLEILQKVRTVRQFSMEKEETKKYTLNNSTRNLFESRIHGIEQLTHEMRFVSHIIGEVYVIYVALMLAVDGKANIADAIVGSTVGMWLQHDMNNMLAVLPKLIKITKPLHRVSSLLACKPRIEQDLNNQNSELLRPERFKGHIEFRDVRFSYPKERQTMVLNGLSFSAKPGQKTALVGKAGCGKSTTMDLLQRFYDRTGGEILVDGQLIEKYDINILRKHIGIVAQTNVLFNRSLYENIVYGIDHPPTPESDEFKEVCVQAQAWDFIQRFPNKQYTIIGEEGVKLSGGQQQRIAIARVIIRKPTFLLLDEATSSLDAINEKAVQQAMDKMLTKFNGVALVVAHRLTTICNCDKIIVMGDDGTKVEEGTHQELLKVPKQEDSNDNPIAGPGLYHTLWDIQQVENKSSEITKLRDLIKKQEAQIEFQKKEIEGTKQDVHPKYPGLHRHLSAPSGLKSR